METHIWNILSQGVYSLGWAGLDCQPPPASQTIPFYCWKFLLYLHWKLFTRKHNKIEIKFKLFSVLFIHIHFYCAILGVGNGAERCVDSTTYIHTYIPFLDLCCVRQCNAIPLFLYTFDSWINNPIPANTWNFLYVPYIF